MYLLLTSLLGVGEKDKWRRIGRGGRRSAEKEGCLREYGDSER